MSAKKVSLYTTIASIVLLIGVSVYSIIAILMCKQQIKGLTDSDLINARVSATGAQMLIWIAVGCVASFLLSLISVMSYTMIGNVFKPNKVFILKLALVFVPMFVAILFLSLQSSMMIK